MHTETQAVVPVHSLDTSEFSQSQQTQAPKRLSADPVPVAADPHWGFRFLDNSQVAPAPDLEDPTSGVLEQLSFVESQEELPKVHLLPADSIQGISRETSAGSLSGPPSAQHLRPARLRGLIFAIMGSVSSLFQV